MAKTIRCHSIQRTLFIVARFTIQECFHYRDDNYFTLFTILTLQNRK